LKQKILTHKIIGVPEVDIVCIGAKTVAFLSEHRLLMIAKEQLITFFECLIATIILASKSEPINLQYHTMVYTDDFLHISLNVL
jgi:hypothetical protein